MSEAEDSGNRAGLQAKFKGVTPFAPYNWELQKEQGWHKIAAIPLRVSEERKRLGKAGMTQSEAEAAFTADHRARR